MKCPIDDTELVMSERQGIEIDYCPKCRGVWLDRGELDKLIQLSAGAEAPRASAPAQATDPYRNAPQRRDFDDSDFGKRQHGGAYRKKSWLSDIFD